MTLLLPICGLAIGAGVGWMSSRLPIGTLGQSIAAALLSSILSSVTIGLIWARAMADERGIGAVTISPIAGVLGLAVVGVSAALIHVLLGWFGETVHSSISRGRPVILGSAIGLAWGMLFAMVEKQIELHN